MSVDTPRPKRLRKAPAYQEYASDLIAEARFKTLSLAERGLLYSMRLQCWVDGAIPRDLIDLARLLGAETAEVQAALTPKVLRFFVMEDGHLVDPELQEQRARQEARREQLADAGRAGAERKHGKSYGSSYGLSHGSLSRDELSRKERSTQVSIPENPEDDVRGYKRAFGEEV